VPQWSVGDGDGSWHRDQQSALLTVDGAALSITIGTGNKVRENDTKTAFIMDWFLSVKDASGHPVPSTAVSLTVPFRFQAVLRVLEGKL